MSYYGSQYRLAEASLLEFLPLIENVFGADHNNSSWFQGAGVRLLTIWITVGNIRNLNLQHRKVTLSIDQYIVEEINNWFERSPSANALWTRAIRLQCTSRTTSNATQLWELRGSRFPSGKVSDLSDFTVISSKIALIQCWLCPSIRAACWQVLFHSTRRTN